MAKIITILTAGQKVHYTITLDLHNAMELACKLKDEKVVTDLSAFGGPELVLVDWKKVALVELSEINIDDKSILTEDFRR